MAVYVDTAKNPFRNYIMSHMWADSLAELLEAADALGLRREWLQLPPKASWVHFDVTQSVKAKALKLGAIQTDKYGPVLHVAKLRGDETMIKRVEALRVKKNGGQRAFDF